MKKRIFHCGSLIIDFDVDKRELVFIQHDNREIRLNEGEAVLVIDKIAKEFGVNVGNHPSQLES